MEKGKRLMDKIVTVCYGKEESWESKEAAEQFFLRAMMESDGIGWQRKGTLYKYLHKTADGDDLLHR